MAIAEIFTLTALGGNLIGWGLGKVCDKSILVGHAEIQKRLQNNGLDPNHDIERAVLTAHYKSLQFIVENTFSQEEDKRVETYSPRLEHSRGRQGFQRIFKAINEGDFKGLAANMAGDWQTVIPTSFETAQSLGDVQQTIPSTYVAQAKADLLSLATWTEIEKEALAENADHPDLGWVTSFSACLREQIKINDAFRHIFFATNQQHQSVMLANIQAQLKTVFAPSKAWVEAMERVENSLNEFREENREAHDKTHTEIAAPKDLIQSLIGDEHYKTEIGEYYPTALADIMIENGTPASLWKEEITTALTRYVEGKAQLEKQNQLPHDLEAKRAEALALYEQAKLDEGEAILQKLVEAVTQDRFETAARDQAMLLIDQVPFATAKLDFNRALDLYEQAANTVLAIDKRQAIEWLNQGADLGYDRGLLFGEGFLNRARSLYQKSLSHIPYGSEIPELGYETLWAATQHNLANIYSVKGERGEDGALDKAIQAYEDALTIQTKDTAPMNWAMTQNNLANVYQVKGERGEDGALDRAIQAYENAPTIFTKDATPIDWAATQNNLANVYSTKGERGEDGALDKAIQACEAALTIRTKEAAPMDWAMTQNNLASVYRVKGERGEDGALDKAIQAYEDALTIRTKDAAPIGWAMIQNNLANVYQVKGERGEDGALDKAIQAYENALTIYTKDATPMSWAMTQNNLANIYSTKGQRGEDGALDKAIQAYENALTIYTKDATPMNWAMTQNNLAIVYRVKGERGEDGALDKAIQAYDGALTIYTKGAAPMNWAITVQNLGNIYWTKGDKMKSENFYCEALSEYKKRKAVWQINRLEKWMSKCGFKV